MKRTIIHIILMAITVYSSLVLWINKESFATVVKEVFLDNYPILLIAGSLYVLFLSKKLTLDENLIHELTHRLFSFLSFEKAQGIHATSSSGLFYTKNLDQNILVVISPYFFPFLTILLVFLLSFIETKYGPQIVLVSYILYQIINIKSIIKSHYELYNAGPLGWLYTITLSWLIFTFIVYWVQSEGVWNDNILINWNYGIIH